jgi:hypothetical protein
MGLLQKWSERRRQLAETRMIEETFDELGGRPKFHQIRGWSRRELHAQIVSGELHPVELSMAKSELQRREQWDAPAGRAFWISVIALLIAAAALVVSIKA